jgi:glutathione S-transferase
MLKLYSHPFSSYSQKVLIALYENDILFEYKDLEQPDNNVELARLWPLKRFPVLVDGDRTILEATTVIEHLHVHHRGPVPLIPEHADRAIEARMLDRVFDNYVMSSMQKPVANRIRPEADRDSYGVAEAMKTLATTYDWLDERLAGRTWAIGDAFSLADCAAAPSLFYADWVQEIGSGRPNLAAYRARLLARPSVARAVDEGRPFRNYFPLGAPDRD